MDLLSQTVDLDERRLYQQSPDILKLLLKDRTTKRHIVWGISSYEYLGKGFESHSPITVRQLTTYYNLIQPRSEKTRSEQKARTKVNAEVFTPTWLVKKQTDFAEEDLLSLSLEDYIDQRWLEITCGEAPYIVTRYDAVSGELLPLSRRVGFLDRKLARISEAVASEGQWLTLVKKAYQASYGYEWQGDSLLLARENLLLTFEDYYEAKFAKKASLADLKEIATIISYNLFQYDDSSKTFFDPYMKSGLYITEIVKRLYNSPVIKAEIPDDQDRLKHILENQVYGLAPSEIIYRIATNFIFGNVAGSISRKNFVQKDSTEAAMNGTMQDLVNEVFGD